jgi:hypothetical protein
MGVKVVSHIKGANRLRVLITLVLGRMCGPVIHEVPGSWRTFYSEELRNSLSSPGCTRFIKSRRMSWAEYVACTMDKKNAHKIFVSKP